MKRNKLKSEPSNELRRFKVKTLKYLVNNSAEFFFNFWKMEWKEVNTVFYERRKTFCLCNVQGSGDL